MIADAVHALAMRLGYREPDDTLELQRVVTELDQATTALERYVTSLEEMDGTGERLLAQQKTLLAAVLDIKRR